MQNWQKLVEQAKKMQKQTSASLYDRVLIINKLNKNEYFHNQCKNSIETLNNLCSDTCATYIELEQLLIKYPRKLQWIKDDLKTMLATLTSEILNKDRIEKRKYKKHTVSLSEYERLKQENKFLREKVRHLEIEIATFKRFQKKSA